jgi:hypothetical protein
MKHLEIDFGPEISDYWNNAKTRARTSSWSVLAVAALIAGGCCDSTPVINDLQNNDLAQVAKGVFYPVSEFVLAIGISKKLELPSTKREMTQAEYIDETLPLVELQPSHILYLKSWNDIKPPDLPAVAS